MGGVKRLLETLASHLRNTSRKGNSTSVGDTQLVKRKVAKEPSLRWGAV